MVNLQTINFDLLNEQEKEDFQKLFNEYLKKIERKLKNINYFIVHFKEYEKDGKGKKFSIHVKIISSAKTIEADTFDWDFKRAVHKVFNKLEQEIEHRFHVLDQNKRKL